LGARDLVIVNRTFERAHELASYVGGRAAPMEALHIEAAMADVVIIATASQTPVLTHTALQHAREACAATGYALLLMDLGVPRNIDHRVAEQAGVTLIDLDTLHQPILDAEEMRRDAVPTASRICEDEIASFMEWLATMPARDAIRPLREALEGVARREVAFAAGGDELVAERTASRIVAKLLAGPISALRRAVQRGEPLDAQAMMLLEMFAPVSPATVRSPRAAHHPARSRQQSLETVVRETPARETPVRETPVRETTPLRDTQRTEASAGRRVPAEWRALTPERYL